MSSVENIRPKSSIAVSNELSIDIKTPSTQIQMKPSVIVLPEPSSYQMEEASTSKNRRESSF
jgi:actin-like ATPase involved in cell morphogenesis